VNYTGSGEPLSSPGEVLYTTPGTGVSYTVTLAVNAGGNGSVTVSSGGNELASQSNLQVGNGPFYVVLGQLESEPPTLGPNAAVWQSIHIGNSTN
jgi:hypothetical protein